MHTSNHVRLVGEAGIGELVNIVVIVKNVAMGIQPLVGWVVWFVVKEDQFQAESTQQQNGQHKLLGHPEPQSEQHKDRVLLMHLKMSSVGFQDQVQQSLVV